LPQLSTIAVNSFRSSSSIPPNNAAAVATTVTVSSDYIEWCKNNNPKHHDSCDCHWEEYQV
jgi:hypothetical protein